MNALRDADWDAPVNIPMDMPGKCVDYPAIASEFGARLLSDAAVVRGNV